MCRKAAEHTQNITSISYPFFPKKQAKICELWMNWHIGKGFFHQERWLPLPDMNRKCPTMRFMQLSSRLCRIRHCFALLWVGKKSDFQKIPNCWSFKIREFPVLFGELQTDDIGSPLPNGVVDVIPRNAAGISADSGWRQNYVLYFRRQGLHARGEAVSGASGPLLYEFWSGVPGGNDLNYRAVAETAKLLEIPIQIFKTKIFDIVQGW